MPCSFAPHSLQHGENLTGWLSVIDWRADDYAVTFCHFVEKFVANIIVEHTFAKVLGMASSAGNAAMNRKASDVYNLAVYRILVQLTGNLGE